VGGGEKKGKKEEKRKRKEVVRGWWGKKKKKKEKGGDVERNRGRGRRKIGKEGILGVEEITKKIMNI
jgi:hypothetical protein